MANISKNIQNLLTFLYEQKRLNQLIRYDSMLKCDIANTVLKIKN